MGESKTSYACDEIKKSNNRLRERERNFVFGGLHSRTETCLNYLTHQCLAYELIYLAW